MDIKKLKRERIEKLKNEAPEEMSAFMKAGKKFKEIDGLSIDADRNTLKEIRTILSFKPSTQEGFDLKRGLLNSAESKAREGMFGNGVFLID